MTDMEALVILGRIQVFELGGLIFVVGFSMKAKDRIMHHAVEQIEWLSEALEKAAAACGTVLMKRRPELKKK